jgi:hypothetical protein
MFKRDRHHEVFHDLTPAESENAGERFLASTRNDNASYLESFGCAQDKLRERSFFTRFSKEARRNTKGLINFNSELSVLRAFVVKL